MSATTGRARPRPSRRSRPSRARSATRPRTRWRSSKPRSRSWRRARPTARVRWASSKAPRASSRRWCRSASSRAPRRSPCSSRSPAWPGSSPSRRDRTRSHRERQREEDRGCDACARGGRRAVGSESVQGRGRTLQGRRLQGRGRVAQHLAQIEPRAAAAPPSARSGSRRPSRRMRAVQQPEQPTLTSPMLDLFLELCAIASPSGKERAVADRVGATLTELGLEWDEDDAAAKLEGDTGNLYCRLPGDRRRPPDLPLRAHGHRPAGGRDRARRRRGRNRPKRRPDDPRLRQQGRGRRHARGGAADRPREPPARGDRARLHAAGGGLAPRGGRVRPHAPARADRLRLRPGRGDRRDRPRLAARAAARLPLPRPRGARGDESRGRQLRDRGRLPRDRRLPPRPPRRGDERERRPDHRRDGAQRRPRVVLVHGRGALARRAEGRRARPRDARDRCVRREPRRVRGRERRAPELPRLPLPRDGRARRPRRHRAARSRLRADLRAVAAAARTRTSSTPAASAA